MKPRLLIHPVFTGAVALLAVNDHVLKGSVGSWWTGKLSDVAGVFVIVVVAGVVTGRPRLAGWAVGAGFVLIKLMPSAAVVAAPLLGGVTRQDASDLIALVAIWPAVALVSSDGDAGGAEVRSVLRRVMLIGSGTVALLTITATSCNSSPEVNGLVVAGDGSIAARIEDGAFDDETGEPSPGPGWAVSDDAGATWRRLSDRPDGPVTRSKAVCSAAVGCFRLLGDRVDERMEGADTWRTAFVFTSEQRARMERRTGWACREPLEDGFAAVAIVSRNDGDHVVVAMGSQGVLQRSPDGRWTRRAVLDMKPVSVRGGPTWLFKLVYVAFAVAILSPVPLLIGRRRGDRTGGALPLGIALVGGGSLVMFAAGLDLAGVDYTIVGPLIAGWSILVFAASLAVALMPTRARGS